MNIKFGINPLALRVYHKSVSGMTLEGRQHIKTTNYFHGPRLNHYLPSPPKKKKSLSRRFDKYIHIYIHHL